MLSLSDVLYLFVNKFSGLGRSCFALALVLLRAFDSSFFRHTNFFLLEEN